MNKKQKRILRVTAAVILMMLLFPPAHYVGNRYAHGSAGYIFILVPSSGVDVSFGLLLTQWVGVVLIAALMWFLSRAQDAVQPSAHSEAKTDHEDMPRLPDQQGQTALYAAFIGAKNAEFYLPRFKLFEERGRIVPTWNWAACIFWAAWFAYRKMYLWALVSFLGPFFLLGVALGIAAGTSDAFTIVDASTIAVITLLSLYALLPAFANGLYYRHARRKIVKIVHRTSNSSQHQLFIASSGGVNTLGACLFGLLIVAPLGPFIATVAIQSTQPTYEPKPQANLPPAEELFGSAPRAGKKQAADDLLRTTPKSTPRQATPPTSWDAFPRVTNPEDIPGQAASPITPEQSKAISPTGTASATPSEEAQWRKNAIPLDEAEPTADWHTVANWRMLKKGTSKANVRRILGEPLKIDRNGGSEHWYYTRKGILGPNVTFYNEKLDGWEEP